jgi:hypothetical protein
MALPVDRDDLLRAVAERAPGGEPLDRLGAALAIGAELGDLAAAVLHGAVADARAAGRSWSQIGEALGVTKQAAQQRFTVRDQPAPGPTGPVERALAAAVGEARRAGRRRVEPADVVLALLPAPEGPTSLAGAALAGLGVDPAAARARLGPGGGPPAPARGRVGRSEATLAVVDRAVALAASRAAVPDTGDLLEALAEAPRGEPLLAGAAPGVGAEVARLRRLGLADGPT